MKKIILFFILIIIFPKTQLYAFDSVSLLNKKTVEIDSPDGFYNVTDRGIYKVKSLFFDSQWNRYKVSIEVLSPKSHPKYGENVAYGYWYPDTQQFYMTTLTINNNPTLRHCEIWSDYFWSYSFKYISKESKIREVWEEISDYPEHRKPRSFCKNVSINRKNCQIAICNERDKLPAKPSMYMFKDLNVAEQFYNAAVQINWSNIDSIFKQP